MENNLIAICSGTKGIGKTWLSVSLCNSFSLLKKKVLFFDADCSIENVAYQLGINCGRNYNLLLNGNTTINNIVYSFDKGGFDIISANSGENILSSAPIGRVQILAKDLFCFSKYYDYTFIDCSDDDIKNANAFLNVCKNIVLVVNADLISSVGAYKKIEKIKKINPNAKIKIIINRAYSYNEGKQIYDNLLKACEDYIKTDLELLGFIRQDSRIRDCVLNKSLLLNKYPASEGAEDIFLVSQKLLEGINNVL